MISEKRLRELAEQVYLEDACSEIRQFNILIDTLERYERTPLREIEKVCLDNIKLGTNSVKIINNQDYIPLPSELENLNKAKDYIESYFDRYGYTSTISQALRDLYKQILRVLSHLKKLGYYPYPYTEGKVIRYPKKKKVELDELTEGEANKLVHFDPNIAYQFYYRKYKNELTDRMNKGESPFLGDIKGYSDLDRIKQLAKQDVERWSRTGQDYNESRGDLRYFFGSTSIGTLMDEAMLSACDEIKREQEKKHIRALGLEQEETLSDIDWAVKALINDVESRGRTRKL